MLGSFSHWLALRSMTRWEPNTGGACHLDIPMVEPALDLLDLDALMSNMARLNPRAKTFQMSSLTGDGVDEWCDYLREFARA